MTEPDPDMAAAELALGVLEGEDRADALRRVLADPAFAREVDRWRDHFAVLFDHWPEAAPPPRVERRVMKGIAPDRVTGRFWPGIAITVSAVAAVLAGVIILRPPSAISPPSEAAGPVITLVANLAPTRGGAAIPAIYDARRQEIRVGAAALVEPGRAEELWIIPADGVPRSLGLLSASSRTTVRLTPAHRALIDATAKLALSSEPAGGSPTGRPTGPILASGQFISI